MPRTKMYIDFITIKGVRNSSDFGVYLWDIISDMYIAMNIFYPFRNGTMTYININILISAYSCLQSCFQIP